MKVKTYVMRDATALLEYVVMPEVRETAGCSETTDDIAQGGDGHD